MICPTCLYDNVPGAEACAGCGVDLTHLDQPVAQNLVELSLMEDTVSALRPSKPVTVRPSTSVRKAVQLMLDCDIGALLVVDATGKLLGIFSERDVLLKAAGEYERCGDLPVERLMTSKPETVTATQNLAFALHKMDVGGYRHLPVVENDIPIGVISVRDMLRHLTRLCK